ncbi:hypothetical protein D3C81_1354670 [compost metagenome]
MRHAVAIGWHPFVVPGINVNLQYLQQRTNRWPGIHRAELLTGLLINPCFRIRCGKGHGFKLRTGNEISFVLVRVVTATNVRVRTRQSQFRPRRLHTVQCKVKPAFVLCGDMKNLLGHSRTQHNIHLTRIGAVRIEPVDRRTNASHRIKYPQKTRFTAGRA